MNMKDVPMTAVVRLAGWALSLGAMARETLRRPTGGHNAFDMTRRLQYTVFMRLFWLTVLVCFLWVYMHEAVAHVDVGECAEDSAGRHHDEGSQSGDCADSHDDHHGSDCHEHFRGAVAALAKPVIKDLGMPGLPVPFASRGMPPQEYLLLLLGRGLCPPAPDPPRYLSAQTLLL